MNTFHDFSDLGELLRVLPARLRLVADYVSLISTSSSFIFS